jgi:hypothetical protein
LDQRQGCSFELPTKQEVLMRAAQSRAGLPAFIFATMVATAPLLSQTQGQQAQQPPAQQQTAQQSAPPAMTLQEILAFARIQLAIDTVRDSVQFAFPVAGNKKDETQQMLQERLRKGVEDVLHHRGMTDAEYKRKVFIVGTDNAVRKTYDSVVVALTGVALPGAVRADAAGGRGGGRGGPAVAPVQVPPGPVGTHVGHVMNSFNDTPGTAGLLRVAQADAGVAAQHATLAARAPDDLAGMKLHAGHVIHALDPTVVTMGPGSGYGLKRAAAGTASHIELAAAAEGASAAVRTHANHVAVAARSASKRADQIIELAKQIQAATAAPAAAALLNQIVSLCNQLTAGADANADGRISWEDGEGGLQQAEEHVMLLLRG